MVVPWAQMGILRIGGEGLGSPTWRLSNSVWLEGPLASIGAMIREGTSLSKLPAQQR